MYEKLLYKKNTVVYYAAVQACHITCLDCHPMRAPVSEIKKVSSDQNCGVNVPQSGSNPYVEKIGLVQYMSVYFSVSRWTIT